MAGAGKICVLCKEDCSAVPRVKDGEGRYACKACLEAKQGGSNGASVAPEPVGAPDDGLEPLEPLEYGDPDAGFGDDDLLALEEFSEPQAAAPVEGKGCPNCGTAVLPGAVICVQCGSSLVGGKKLKTKVSSGSAAEKTGEAAAKAAIVSGIFARWIVAGLLAAGGGAAVWAFLSIQLGVEIKIVAVGVGALCGGAVMASTGGGYLGIQSGAIAAVCTLLGLFGGKFWYNYHYISEILPTYTDEVVEALEDWPSERDCLQKLADEIVQDRLDHGETSGLISPGMMVEFAIWPEDYSRDVRDETRDAWGVMSQEEQDEYRDSMIVDACLQRLVDEIAQSRVDRGESIDWPEDGMSIEYAVWPYDYPEELETETREKWASMNEGAREAYREQLYAEIENFEITEADIQEAAAIGAITDFHIFYFIWFPVAMIVAYGIASGGDLTG